MTELKKTKAAVKNVPAKKVTKNVGASAKVLKESMVSVVKKPTKTPSVTMVKAIKPSDKVPTVSTKKLPPKKINKKEEPSSVKLDVPKSEVSSFMHEMQKQVL